MLGREGEGFMETTQILHPGLEVAYVTSAHLPWTRSHGPTQTGRGKPRFTVVRMENDIILSE